MRSTHCPLGHVPETKYARIGNVCDHKPNGRTVAADRGYAPTRAKAMLALKHQWRERGPLKPGEMQVGTPEWMKDRPEYRRVTD
jgi:hypothetical protein